MNGRPVLALALLLGAGAVACAEPPTVDTPPGDAPDAGGRAFADTLVGYSVDGQPVTCTEGLAACGEPAGGACAGDAGQAAVGPNDAMRFDLGAGGRIELAFRCGLILETGGAGGTISPDFKVWATVAAGASAVVEVSFDGSRYRQLAWLDEADETFALEELGEQQVRFVRIADTGPGGIAIDAVEALPVP